jgi:hypothetical protein
MINDRARGACAIGAKNNAHLVADMRGCPVLWKARARLKPPWSSPLEEGARNAGRKRDQQKWIPVLRPVAPILKTAHGLVAEPLTLRRAMRARPQPHAR